jgi:hypothetical protein
LTSGQASSRAQASHSNPGAARTRGASISWTVGLGWTTLDLFGVHPEAGAIRPDFCGALVLSDAPITAITANRMAFLNTAFYRDTPASLPVRCRSGRSGGDAGPVRPRPGRTACRNQDARSCDHADENPASHSRG